VNLDEKTRTIAIQILFFTSVLLGAVREVLHPFSVEADSAVGTDCPQLAKDSGKNERGEHLQVAGRMEQKRR
jgi:hypothetical protein